MSSTETPSRAISPISSWSSVLVLMSMPTVGSSTIRISVSAASHLAIETFCWLPPERVDRRVDRRRADRQPSDERARGVRLGARRDQAEDPGDAPPDGDRDIVPDRIGEDQALLLAVLADVADAIVLERLVHRGCGPAAADADLAAGDAAVAEDAAGELAPAGADQAVEPEDFALVEAEVDVAVSERGREPLSSRTVWLGRGCAARCRRPARRGRSSATPAVPGDISAIGSSAAAILPSRSTVTRSESESTSSSLWLTKTMATPSP